MGKNALVKSTVFLKTALVILLLLGITASPLRVISGAVAADLPLATTSPLVGVPFDDRPLALPVQRNFQMAMLTASSELGRTCGRMEAYGWRMGQTEQARVNQIFTTTVDHLRNMGYTVEAQAPTSVSHDITMFTADRNDRHFVFMWSAGELGLVMVLCESSQPLHYHNATSSTPSVQVFPQGQDILQSTLDTPKPVRPATIANFMPVGDWVGSYTCEQGYTGGTLQIAHLRGEDFDGIFRFYPTPKNPSVPMGRYTVYGQYDRASQRILINPGKWLERPKNYYNTIMVGSFDPVARTFSAYFQGINGCTSFEAKAASEDYESASKPTKHAVKKKHKKKIVKKKPVVHAAPVTPTDAALPAPAEIPTPASPTPALSTVAPPAQAAPETAAPTAAPAPPAPADAGPSSIVLPAPTPAPSTPPATAAPVSITPPSVAPPSSPATAPAQPAPQGKPSGALEPRHSPKLIQVADSGQWFIPTSPQAQQPTYVNPPSPAITQAPSAPTAEIAPPATIANSIPPSVSPAIIAPQPIMYNTDPPQVPPAQIAPQPITAPDAYRFLPVPQAAPQPQYVPDYRPASQGIQSGPNP